ncbi:hypothetical protein MBLNU457_4734t1 [Dothideomycetes sp. NU457]
MDSFEYNSHPARVLFGHGTIYKLPEELARLGVKKPLLLCTGGQRHQAEKLKAILSGSVAGIFSEAVMHTPVHVTEKANTYCTSVSADCLISIGGGSTIGLGKALGIRTSLPHISIPTTYSGSEMTPILGETEGGKKTTRSDPKIIPTLVLYDVDLTMTLPPATSATSGINALAHAVEALYARNPNPITSLMALEAIKSLSTSLPKIVADSASHPAREAALYGAWLAAVCLSTVGVALHHKLCHVLGGSLGLPHAETHTIVLPHVLVYNAPAIPDVMDKLAGVLPGSEGDAIVGLNLLLGKLGVTRGLRELGMKEEDIDIAVNEVSESLYWNPRTVEPAPLREVIRRCWAGEEARADF